MSEWTYSKSDIQHRKPKKPVQHAAHTIRFSHWCGLAESEPLILPINEPVMGNRTHVDSFAELVRLMPLMIRLMYGEWRDGAMHVGFAWILKYLRPAR